MFNQCRFSFLLVSIFTNVASAQVPSANQILAQSIEYHDPEGRLMTQEISLALTETRPNGSDRKTNLKFDLLKESFEMERSSEGNKIKTMIDKGEITFTLNGSTEFTDEQKKQFRLEEDRAVTMKNYYQYLWLLPLKLKDPGTIIDQNVQQKDFFGKPSFEIKVTYSEKVGHDIWYFYFHPETKALQGYRFYHDETVNDGEYILLEGESSFGNVRLPMTRKWFTHKEDKFLGSDILEKIILK